MKYKIAVTTFSATILISIHLLACSAGDSIAQGAAAEVDARELIAAQVASEFGVWQQASDGRVNPDNIQVESGPTLVTGLDVLRGIPPRDHWHPYLIVVRDGSLCTAGGFTSPELDCVAHWLRESQSMRGPIEVSQTLAILADKNGAVRAFHVAKPNSAREREVREVWQQHRPENWPRDTTLQVSNGGTVVRLTMLSQQARSYEQAWTAIVYDFRFDSDERFITWSRRVSEAFGPPPPSSPAIR